MEFTAIVLFGLAAVGGLFLAVRHFKGQELPMPVALLHGLLAASGLAALAWAYLQSEQGQGWRDLALLILLLAALGGFFVFSFHLRGRRAPSAAVAVHALAALAGVLALLVAIL